MFLKKFIKMRSLCISCPVSADVDEHRKMDGNNASENDVIASSPLDFIDFVRPMFRQSLRPRLIYAEELSIWTSSGRQGHLLEELTSADDDIITPNEIKSLMEETIKKLGYWSHLSWDVEGSGSIYTETEEITNRSDYDYMLCPIQVQCILEPCWEHPCYCRVFITNKHELPLEFQEILGPHDELDPLKFKDYVFPLFNRIVEGKYTLDRLENKDTSPAYTVFHTCDYWTENNLDWVPCLRIREPPPFCTEWNTKKMTEEEKMTCPIYVVAKTIAANGKLWRISFSTIEKKILREKCSNMEKRVIRYLKFQLINLKESDKTKKMDDWDLCSYYVINHCLRFFEIHPAEEYGNYRDYLRLAQCSLIDALKQKNIQHFFIRNVNLLQDVDIEECRQFILKLQQD